MTEGWGGAQWVLLTLYVFNWFLRLAFMPVRRAAREWKSTAAFAGSEAPKWIDDAIVLSIISWGGFWS